MNLEELEKAENLEPITLFKAYSNIISNESTLDHLYKLWKVIPKTLKFKFWIQGKNSDYLTIH